jgi:hypothetical protein
MQTRHFISLTVLYLALVTGTAHSANFSETYISAACKSADDASVMGIGQSLAHIGSVLPNVSPEESKYLEAESASVQLAYSEENAARRNHQVSGRRYADLISRPFYYLWKVRQNLQLAVEMTDAIVDAHARTKFEGWGYDLKKNVGFPVIPFKNADAIKLAWAIDSVSSLAAFAMSVSVFVTREEFRSGNELLTEGQRADVSSESELLAIRLQNFMTCKLAKSAAID